MPNVSPRGLYGWQANPAPQYAARNGRPVAPTDVQVRVPANLASNGTLNALNGTLPADWTAFDTGTPAAHTMPPWEGGYVSRTTGTLASGVSAGIQQQIGSSTVRSVWSGGQATVVCLYGGIFPANVGVRAELWFYNAADGFLGVGATAVVYPNATVVDWRTLVARGTVPVGAVYMKARVYAVNDGVSTSSTVTLDLDNIRVYHHGSPFRPADFPHTDPPAAVNPLAVYTYDAASGVYLPVWASYATSPPSPTAVYTASQVAVSWTWPEADRLATLIRVWRTDGTLVGEFPGTTTTVIDTLPVPVSGTYTVQGTFNTVGVAPGPIVATNSLALVQAPATLVATYNAAVNPPQVDLVWTAPPYGQPDAYDVFDPAGNYITRRSPTSLFYADTTPPYGGTGTYEVRAVLSNQTGAQRFSNVINIAPFPPVNLSVVSNNMPSAPGTVQVAVRWSPPITGAYTNFQVALWDNVAGAWTSPHTISSPTDGQWQSVETVPVADAFNVAHQPSWFVRVRTSAPGGVSAWVGGH